MELFLLTEQKINRGSQASIIQIEGLESGCSLVNKSSDIHYRTSVPLNCSLALNCMDPSKRPQAIPASSVGQKEPWVFHLPCKHVGASHKSPKPLFSTTLVSNSPGSWLKNKDIGMMCHFRSIDATCVFLPGYLLTNWTGLNATEIIR